MQTIDDVKMHCRGGGVEIEKAVADGEGLGAKCEGVQMIRNHS